MSAIAVYPRIDGPEKAPLLVLSHSLGLTLESWDLQIPMLTRSFRVVRYDLRGHGRSPVVPGPYSMADLGGDVVALLDRLGATRAHLCGLSIGAMISLWVAAHHPDRVDRLVACCTSAQLGPSSMWIERAARVRVQGTASVADEVVGRWFTGAFRTRYPERVAAMRDTIAATSAEAYAACCDAIATMDLRPDLSAIRAPTLVVAAAEDPATPPEHSHEIARGIRGARVVVVEAAAHLATVERADATSRLIDSHLRIDRETT